MDKIKKFLNNELKNWSKWDVLWIILANVIILGVSLTMGDSTIGIIASISGTLCVILTGMGKMSSFIFGMINIIFYAIVAYEATYYGDVMLNIFYYLPTNIIGWFMWKKNINNEKGEVKKERLKLKTQIIVAVLSVLGIVIYGYILSHFTNDALPYTDSMSTVLSITAQILLMKRCMEQWLVWIVVDGVSVFMWIMAFFNGGASVATLLMWIVYLVNAIIMFVKWNKESKGGVQNV